MIYQKEYTKEISFPLGGIGSGCIGLNGNGMLTDWEIFNRPNKGSLNGHSHFAIKAKTSKGSFAKVLNGDLLKDYTGQYRKSKFNGFGFGPDGGTMCGFPHFSEWSFKGEFPIAELTFSDPDFPGEIQLTAFNPFIPLEEDNSSIPGAFFELTVTNHSEEEIEYLTAFSVQNPFPGSQNSTFYKDAYRMLSFKNTTVSEDDVAYGDLTIATDSPDTLVQTYWYRGGWQDPYVTFWNNFGDDTDLKDRVYDMPHQSKDACDHGTLATRLSVVSGERKTVRFILTWNIPNNYNHWNDAPDESGRYESWKNYYAVLFADSSESAFYALKNWDMLKQKTLLFHDILHRSTLDPAVIDAVSSTLSVLKSPTVLRLEDGSFYGWEGVHEQAGSCEGTCQHVWNYAYALCFLFPKLERSIRENEFRYTVLDSGKSVFRMKLPRHNNPGTFRACVDGQMGIVIKSYREWKISGDDSWLKKYWDRIQLVLDYARSELNEDEWDRNGDGILEGRQHHTLDMELFGPSSWLESMYLAALKAAAEMADYLGDTGKAKEYTALFENGYRYTKKELFNGSYFIQKLDLNDQSVTDYFHAEDYWNTETSEIKYQIGEGCSIDQLLGQWHAKLTSLGDVLDTAQIDRALETMYETNFIPHMRDFTNPWRVFSLNDEGGTVICGYPAGSRKPKIPIPYCEETMTGFEYQFAAMLIYYDKIDKGLSVVKAIRDRYDGNKRNPYNEIECGSNYARAMAAFSLLPAFSGFEYHLSKGHIGFCPKTDDTHFSCLYNLGTGWGEFTMDPKEATIRIAGGTLSLCSVSLPFREVQSVEIDHQPISFTVSGHTITFPRQTIANSLRIIMK